MLALAGLVALWLVVDGLYTRQSGPLMVQAWQNVRFTERPSLERALERYPKAWPPLYPLLLRGWTRLGLPWARFNEALLLLSLALLGIAARSILSGAPAIAVVALWAVAHFNYVDGYQPTADALVVPLLLLLYLLLLKYGSRPRLGTLLAAAFTTQALLLSRYFALFGVLPAAGLVLALAPDIPPRRRLLHSALLAMIALPSLGLWAGYAYRQTSYLTGADRHAARRFPDHLLYWRDLTSPSGNLRMEAKAVFLDVFSTRRPGVLAFVTTDYVVFPLEWTLLGLAVTCVLVGAWAGWTVARREPASSAGARASRAPALLRSPVGLAAVLFTVYLVALVAVWSVGNNDPLHSRYLWPSYPFLLLLALSARAAVAHRWNRDFWPALPFRLMWALLLVVHIQRSLAAVPVPVRYDLEPEPVEPAGEPEPPTRPHALH